jgi:hypothetical protein
LYGSEVGLCVGVESIIRSLVNHWIGSLFVMGCSAAGTGRPTLMVGTPVVVIFRNPA